MKTSSGNALKHIYLVYYIFKMEDTCTYVSSRGIMKSCSSYQRHTIRSSNPYLHEDILHNVKDGDTVYICTTAIPMFAQYYLQRLKTHIVLVSGDADDSIPSVHEQSCIAILQSPYILQWFAQNCVLDHTKLVHLPIGLDYHTMSVSDSRWGSKQSPIEQEQSILNIASGTAPFYERLRKCYSTFHFALNRGDRQEAYDSIPKELVMYEPTFVTRTQSHVRQAEYAFVLSPFGGGPDCHRTWEALILGCIPIICSSNLDSLFEGLPVLIVNSWKDVTQELLDTTVESYKGRTFQYEKLTMKYWINKMMQLPTTTTILHPVLESKCCICLCVYNNAFGLPYVLKNILAIRDTFTEYRIIVFYDESTDGSIDILEKHNYTYNDMDIVKNTKNRGCVRTENIAFARNQLLDIIRKSYPNYEYFIMMDSNEYSCIGDIRKQVLVDIMKRYDWDAASFDREAGYYDTWALSFDPYVYSFFHFNDWAKVVGMMRQTFANILEDYSKNRPSELIEVYSAFNGFSIYRTQKFLNCSYSSYIDLSLFPDSSISSQESMTGCKTVDSLYDDCEHRKFHLEAINKNNARVRICTSHLFSKFINPPAGLRGPA